MAAKKMHKKKMPPLGAGLAVGALLALPVKPALAVDDYFDLSLSQLLSAQVVSVSKTLETVAETPAAVYVITQEDIARSGMTSIPELLRMAPGVNVAQADSNTWAISIRGFNNTSANKLLVMMDGRTIYNPLFAGTYWEAQDVVLEDIERIEIIRGPGGTLWGANAVNGVINIITKNAKDTAGTLLKGGVGTYEKGFAMARYGGSSGDDFHYRAHLKTSHRDNFKNVAGGEANDSWASYHGGFRTDWDKDNQNKVTFQGGAYHVDSDAMVSSFALVAPFTTVTPETIESKGANILGRWKHDYADASSFSAQAYVDYTERNQTLIGDRRFIYDLEGQYNLRPLGRHEIITGAHYRLVSDELTGSPIVTFNPGSVTHNLFGAFVQDKITLDPGRWSLTLGSKFEHNDYTGFEFQPNARLLCTPGGDQTVWAAVSRAVRTPSRVERDLDITNVVVAPGGIFGPDPTRLVLAANKGFKSEEVIAYELGYRKQLTPLLSLDTAAFMNDYKHLASTDAGAFVAGINNGVDPIHNLLPLTYANDMTAEVYGIEMASIFKPRKDWKLSVNYTFLQMFLHAPPVFGTSQDGPEHRSPNHQAGLRSYWDVNDQWSLDTSLYYVSKLSDFEVPAYVRLDANLGWKINKDVLFNLVGQNLLDGAHREFSSPTGINAAQAPRGVFGKFTWQF